MNFSAPDIRRERHTPTLAYVVIFLFALGLSCWYNFGSQHIDASLACDASEYVRDAQGLMRLTAELGNHHVMKAAATAAADSVQRSVSLRELSQGGPVFPAFLALCFAIGHTTSTAAPVFAQCILAGLSAVFVISIATEVWDKRVAILAGVIQSIYPAFIIASGRLYSESFALFLSCAATWFVVRALKNKGTLAELFLLGVTLYALQLTRSLDLLLTVVCVPLAVYAHRGRRMLASVTLVLGLVCVMAPWLVLQNVALGKSSLLVDRVGQYNAFIGNNVGTQGWLSFPYPNGGVANSDGIAKLIVSSAADSPEKWFRLMIDKTIRFLKFPWNDFRASIGPFGPSSQVLFHQVVLCIAVIGAFLSACKSITIWSDEPAKQSCRNFLLCSALLSLSYVFFISVPRYNLQLMPLVIMFASAGVFALAHAVKRYRTAALAVCCSLALLFVCEKCNLMPYLVHACSPYVGLIVACVLRGVLLLASCVALVVLLRCIAPTQTALRRFVFVFGLCLLPVMCLPSRANGRWYEWRTPFDRAGQQVQQDIDVPPLYSNLSSRKCFLAINANGMSTLTSCDMSINGIKVDAPILQGIAAVQNYRQLKHENKRAVFWEGEYIFDCMTPVVGACNSDLRQWFYVPLSEDVITSIADRRRAAVTLTRTSDAPAGAIFGSYAVGGKKLELPALKVYSWEKAFYGVENDDGLTDPSLDQKVDAKPVNRSIDLSSDPGLQSGAFDIRLVVSREEVEQPDAADKLATLPLEFEQTKSGVRATITDFPQIEPDDLWIFQVQGAGIKPGARIQMTMKSIDKDKTIFYVSPWVPRAAADSKPFDWYAPLQPGALPGPLNFLRVRIDEAAVDELQKSRPKLTIWRLNKGPLARGYKVL